MGSGSRGRFLDRTNYNCDIRKYPDFGVTLSKSNFLQHVHSHRSPQPHFMAYAASPLWAMGVRGQPAHRGTLVRMGLDVTLFATGDSQTSGKLVAVCPHPYSEDSSVNPKVAECLHISEVFEQSADFDLIHNHFDFLPLTYSGLVDTPVLTTIHGFSSPAILPVYKKYNGSSHYVAISEADKSPELDYIATVHHGIDISQFPFSESSRKVSSVLRSNPSRRRACTKPSRWRSAWA